MSVISRLGQAARLSFVVLAAAITAAAPNSGRADPTVDPVACSVCQSFADRLTLVGQGPAFLASYEAYPEGDPLLPVLRDVAFVYDNALVIIALIGCGRTEAATPIADALLYALDNDRHYQDGAFAQCLQGWANRRPDQTGGVTRISQRGCKFLA